MGRYHMNGNRLALTIVALSILFNWWDLALRFSFFFIIIFGILWEALDELDDDE